MEGQQSLSGGVEGSSGARLSRTFHDTPNVPPRKEEFSGQVQPGESTAPESQSNSLGYWRILNPDSGRSGLQGPITGADGAGSVAQAVGHRARSAVQSPLAFADAELEEKFVAEQMAEANRTTVFSLWFWALLFAVALTRTAPSLAGRALMLCWAAGAVGIFFLYRSYLRQPFLHPTPCWVAVNILFRLQHILTSVLIRGVFQESLGQSPLTAMSFVQDYMHGGMGLIIFWQNVTMPLPYWPCLLAHLLSPTMLAVHNGWLCAERLKGPHARDTVAYLSKVLVEPTTVRINSMTLYGPPGLLPYEVHALHSCEGVVGFVQWATAVGTMLASVGWEVWTRYRFMRKQIPHARSGRSIRGMGWKRRALARGVSLVMAFILPVVVFARLWQAFLVMLSWVATQWATDQVPLSTLLRLPYLFWD
eukprot:jgi/Botrbrau1/11269/Bobra.0038s0040.2